MTVEFLLDAMEDRRKWNNIPKVKKRKNPVKSELYIQQNAFRK